MSPANSSRSILRAAAWAIGLASLWGAFAAFSSGTSLRLIGDSIQRVEGHPEAITLPFRDVTRTAISHYRITGTIVAREPPHPVRRSTRHSTHETQPQWFRVIPDDCVDSLEVGGQMIDLRQVPAVSLCNWNSGFRLDLAPYLSRTGRTPFTAGIRNSSGPLGFSLLGPEDGFRTDDVKLIPLATVPAPVRLPFTRDDDPTVQTYVVRGRFVAGRFAKGRLRIVPDDCLLELTIGGHPVSLNGLKGDQLCDWKNGFTLDVTPALPADGGAGPFTATVLNRGGPYGLSIRTMPSLIGAFSVLCELALLALSFWAALSWLGLPGADQRYRAVAAGLLAFGTAIRYAVIFNLHPAIEHAFSDAGNYLEHATSIANGRFWIGQTFQGIGYPVLLAAAFRLDPHGGYSVAYAMQLVASVLTVIIAWRATARLLGERIALWALLILAFHFPFIGLSGFFMAETIFGLGVTILFYLLARFAFPWSATSGFAIGVAYMAAGAVKGLNGFFAPLYALWTIGHAWRLGLFTGTRRDPRLIWRRALGPLVAFAAGAAVFGVLQGAITAHYYGVFQLSAPTGALNLVEGKCPEKLNRDSTGAFWLSPLFAQLGEMQEKRWPRPFTDQAFYWHAGLDCIRAHPSVLLTSFRYVYFLFFGNEIWPTNMTRFHETNRVYSLLFALLFLPGIAIGLGRAFRQPFATRALPYLPAFAILLCSWALKSEMRYRVPFDAVFIAAGLAGWAWLFEASGLARRLPPNSARAAWVVLAGGLFVLVALPIFFAQ